MWTILFVLPNVRMEQDFGNEWISIAPSTDARIKEFVDNNPYAKVLAERFEDQFGRKINPSFLIVKNDCPNSVFNIEAIVGFRNILALTTIIEGHAHSLTSSYVAYPLYSDYFELYPIVISKNNDGFITNSPSVSAYDDEYERFRGQTSPGLAGGFSLSPNTDSNLIRLLITVWERRFLKSRTSEWSTTVLFRSMQLAYQASAMPFKNYATVYDYGSSASLWVSALEILSHPRKGKADLFSVLRLIDRYNWKISAVNKRRYKITKTRVNLVQKLYKELYDTRNEFLHGNPISNNRLYPFRNKKNPVITRFAPLIYRVALYAFLSQYHNRTEQKNHQKDIILKSFMESSLCEAFLKAKTKNSLSVTT